MITRRDPEWDDADRAIMMAARDIETDIHDCGHPLSETLMVRPDEMPDDYVQPVYDGETRICLACLARSKLLARWDKKDDQSRETAAGDLERMPHPMARVITVRRTN